MATDVQIYDQFTNNQSLFKKVLVENLKAAAYILDEDSGTPSHAERLLWAKYVITNPWQAAQRMMVLVMSNGDIQSGEEGQEDATVAYVVTLYTTKLALVGLTEPNPSTRPMV